MVRREQLDDVLPSLIAAPKVGRFVLMVNHANGSGYLFSALGRSRVVLGFPSLAGGIENGVDVYVDVAEQPTTLERTAPDIARMLRTAGFRVTMVADVDSWLRRHAVFVTAIGGALYAKEGNASLLAGDKKLMRTLILAVREGWAALDRQGDAPPPLPLRIIFGWVPLPFAIDYWSRLFRSPRGEYYFARHVRQAPAEMAALAADVRQIIPPQQAPHLDLLYSAIHRFTGADT
jgi:2-dehydropantoate 2-reductase